MLGQVIQLYYVRVLSIVFLIYSASVAGEETFNSIHTYSYIIMFTYKRHTVTKMSKKTDRRNTYSGMRY